KFCTNGPIDCSPAVDGNGIIYFGSRDSTLYALYPDGNVRWTYKANGGFESSPTLDGNGYLYIGNFDGNLYAFGTGAPDLGVSSIDVPDLIKPEYTYSPAVTLNNYRSTFQNFDVVCLIDTQGYYVYGDTIHVSNLIGGQMSQKSFSPWLVGPDSNVIYTITAYTLIPEDDNTPNDTLLKNVSTSDDIIIIRGDVNSNSELSAADVVYLISYLFRSGPLPVIWETGDVNCDDGISVSDAIYLINYLWKGGPAPC
ncbi:MAG: PQQ-binding-like beta-propeller repeat protein, partial [candidate division Zixibacteria bacterium]|nr:PQQ-binding-like beta-propeller repeat protein [candidate division Zixibacteria bacterium]